MRKLTFSIGSVLILCVGCHKAAKNSTVVSSTASQVKTEAETITAARHTKPVNLRTLYHFQYECHPPSENCLPDVVITGMVRANLISAIDLGLGNVSAFFNDPLNQPFIATLDFEPLEISNLQNGTYLMSYGQSTERPNAVCFLIGPPPVSPDNFVTAVPILTQ